MARLSVDRLFTVGDGFAYNHYWPMWSQLLANVLECEWTNFSLPGLGNEAIANIVLDGIDKKSGPNDLWVIQWGEPHRFDLMITPDSAELLEQIKTDTVYYKNFIETAKSKRFWSSSVSTLPFVTEHKKILPGPQIINRSRLYQHAVAKLIEDSGANWIYAFTYDSAWSSNLLPQQNVIVEPMEKFARRSKFNIYDVGEIQPVGSIHLDFLNTYVLPGVHYDSSCYDRIFAETVNLDMLRKQQNSHSLGVHPPIVRTNG